MPSSSRIFAASFITSRSLELPIRMPTSGWAAFVRAAFAAGFAAGFGAFAAAFAEGFAAFAVMRFSLLFGARAGRVRYLALALVAFAVWRWLCSRSIARHAMSRRQCAPFQ